MNYETMWNELKEKMKNSIKPLKELEDKYENDKKDKERIRLAGKIEGVELGLSYMTSIEKVYEEPSYGAYLKDMED